MTTAIKPREVTPETKPSVSTADVLALVETVFDRYVIFPSPPARTAAVLWVAHTHAMDAWSSTPRLAVTSSDPGSGKTRVLELIAELVPYSLSAVNLTPVVMWRTLAKGNVTMIIDEADTLFGKAGSSSANRQLRAIINAGHRRGAMVPRATGAADVTNFAVYGACALGGLGAMPETVAVRSVRIHMRKATDAEHVQPYRPSECAAHLAAVRGTLAIWGLWALDDLARARPLMPVDGRDADVWEPLTAIADHAGGEWSDRVRDACSLLTAETEHRSIGTMLLADIREVWPAGQRCMFTTDLLAALHSRDGWSPRNLDAGSLARHLAPYEVTPGTVRVGNRTAKGYKLDQLSRAWHTFLPSHVTTQAAQAGV